MSAMNPIRKLVLPNALVAGALAVLVAQEARASGPKENMVRTATREVHRELAFVVVRVGIGRTAIEQKNELGQVRHYTRRSFTIGPAWALGAWAHRRSRVIEGTEPLRHDGETYEHAGGGIL